MNQHHLGNHDTPEFSWSLARHGLFNRCRRAYYYRYYGAAGGWDIYADERKRFMYLFKHMKKADAWLEELTKHVISSVFQKNRSAAGKEILEKHIYSEFSRLFFQGWHQLQAREWQGDPVKLNLFETYYSDDDSSFFSSIEQVKTRMGNDVKAFVASPIFEELASLDFLSWKLHAKPVSFHANGIKVWAAPDLVWADKGHICLLDVRLNAKAKEKKKKDLFSPAAIGTLMAKHKLRTEPAKVDFRTVYVESLPEKGSVESFDSSSVDLKKLEESIAVSADEMRSLLGKHGEADEAAFPMVSDSPAKDCSACEYKLLCTDYQA